MNGLTNNSGQICFAASRVYVQEGIYDKFIAAYQKAFEAKRAVTGDPNAAGSEIGPVVDKAQYDRILGIVDNAKEEGQGTLLVGGKPLLSKVGYKPWSSEAVAKYTLTDCRAIMSNQPFLRTLSRMRLSTRKRFLVLSW